IYTENSFIYAVDMCYVGRPTLTYVETILHSRLGRRECMAAEFVAEGFAHLFFRLDHLDGGQAGAQHGLADVVFGDGGAGSRIDQAGVAADGVLAAADH